MTGHTCGNCLNFDLPNLECVYEDQDGARDRHSPSDAACGDWHALSLTAESKYEVLESVATNVAHSISILIDDPTVKDMPRLYLVLEKMRDQLRLALEFDCDE